MFSVNNNNHTNSNLLDTLIEIDIGYGKLDSWSAHSIIRPYYNLINHPPSAFGAIPKDPDYYNAKAFWLSGYAHDDYRIKMGGYSFAEMRKFVRLGKYFSDLKYYGFIGEPSLNGVKIRLVGYSSLDIDKFNKELIRLCFEDTNIGIDIGDGEGITPIENRVHNMFAVPEFTVYSLDENKQPTLHPIKILSLTHIDKIVLKTSNVISSEFNNKIQSDTDVLTCGVHTNTGRIKFTYNTREMSFIAPYLRGKKVSVRSTIFAPHGTTDTINYYIDKVNFLQGNVWELELVDNFYKDEIYKGYYGNNFTTLLKVLNDIIDNTSDVGVGWTMTTSPLKIPNLYSLFFSNDVLYVSGDNLFTSRLHNPNDEQQMIYKTIKHSLTGVNILASATAVFRISTTVTDKLHLTTIYENDIEIITGLFSAPVQDYPTRYFILYEDGFIRLSLSNILPITGPRIRLSSENLNDGCFIGTNTAIIVGNGGVMLINTTLPAQEANLYNWNRANSPFGNTNINKIKTFGNICISIGDLGKIAYCNTSNIFDWHLLEYDRSAINYPSLKDFCDVNGKIYIVGSNGFLCSFIFENNIPVGISTLTTPTNKDLHCIIQSGNNIIIAGKDGTTLNLFPGEMVANLFLVQNTVINDVSIMDKFNIAFIGCNNGFLYLHRNFNNSWERITFPPLQRITSITAVCCLNNDEDQILIGTSTGNIQISSDLGKSWYQIRNHSGNKVNKIINERGRTIACFNGLLIDYNINPDNSHSSSALTGNRNHYDAIVYSAPTTYIVHGEQTTRPSDVIISICDNGTIFCRETDGMNTVFTYQIPGMENSKLVGITTYRQFSESGTNLLHKHGICVVSEDGKIAVIEELVLSSRTMGERLHPENWTKTGEGTENIPKWELIKETNFNFNGITRLNTALLCAYGKNGILYKCDENPKAHLVNESFDRWYTRTATHQHDIISMDSNNRVAYAVGNNENIAISIASEIENIDMTLVHTNEGLFGKSLNDDTFIPGIWNTIIPRAYLPTQSKFDALTAVCEVGLCNLSGGKLWPIQ